MKYKERKRLRILGKILFVCYIIFIIYFLIFSEWYGRTGEMSEYRYNLVLFKEINRFLTYREELGTFAVLTNVVGNVWIFMPFGFFMPMASRYRNFFTTVFYGFFLSLCVELFQLVTRVGCFDVDDLLLNTVGCILGYMMFGICNAIRRNYHAKQK